MNGRKYLLEFVYFKHAAWNLKSLPSPSKICFSFFCFFKILYIFIALLYTSRRRSDLCGILHTQVKGITTNPLCSQRSWRVSLHYSLKVFFWCVNHLHCCRESLGAVCHSKSGLQCTACLSVYLLLHSSPAAHRKKTHSLHTPYFAHFPGYKLNPPPLRCALYLLFSLSTCMFVIVLLWKAVFSLYTRNRLPLQCDCYSCPVLSSVPLLFKGRLFRPLKGDIL